jgi:hypothetical protein
MPEISLDRAALREIISNLRPARQETDDWCVACGASAASAKLDFPAELVNQAGKQFLDPTALRQFVGQLKEIGLNQAWCVACGAGKGSSPLDPIVNPATISDEEIDAIAEKVLGAVRME